MRLGDQPTWTDPGRSQSINVSRGPAELERPRLLRPRERRKCWPALNPAQLCLHDTWTKMESLFRKDTTQIALASGEMTNPGYSFDRFMWGRNEGDAQPTIIFDCCSERYRANAKAILHNEEIEVDARGIGLEFYENGPVFSAGKATGDPLAQISGFPEIPLDDNLRRPFGYPVSIGSMKCIMSGVISISGKLFGLTVGHVFNVAKLEKGNRDP